MFYIDYKIALFTTNYKRRLVVMVGSQFRFNSP